MDHAVVAGVPASQIGWACKCGSVLKFDNENAQCEYCSSKYGLENGHFDPKRRELKMERTSAEKVPMLDLRLEFEYMRDDIESAIGKCMDHQKWILRPEVGELEANVARYLGAEHCAGCPPGTEALGLSLRALAIKTKGKEYFSRDDEIITTPFTFTATGDAILRSGATPVFVDIDPLTYNIDANNIKSYMSVNRSKVVGIMPVHLYGHSCDIGQYNNIAGEYGIFVIEDVAQAFGGQWKGRKLGSVGTAGAFSFVPSKNLGGFWDGWDGG